MVRNELLEFIGPTFVAGLMIAFTHRLSGLAY